MRCDYLMATLNPDDPSLPVYEENINHSRPLPGFENDAPAEMTQMLSKEPKSGWVHWFFSFDHNLGLTEEKKVQIIGNVPVGTKLYKNKIQGLRGRVTGLVFDLQQRNIITPAQAKKYKFAQFTCGEDTSYSQQSDDTFAFIFSGITVDRKKITLAEQVYNNKDLKVPITPSDIPPLLIRFLDRCREEWGFGKNVFIDSADQGTILECQKYKRAHGSMYLFNQAWKKLKVIDRINLQCGWMAHEDFLVVDTCKESIREMNLYTLSLMVSQSLRIPRLSSKKWTQPSMNTTVKSSLSMRLLSASVRSSAIFGAGSGSSRPWRPPIYRQRRQRQRSRAGRGSRRILFSRQG